jgi:hypothetical protein
MHSCVFIIFHIDFVGHALPSTKEEWETIHPGKDWLTDRDNLLPGYLGRSHILTIKIFCLYFYFSLNMQRSGSRVENTALEK